MYDTKHALKVSRVLSNHPKQRHKQREDRIMALAQRTATTATRTMPRLETATETDIESQPARIEHDCIGSTAVPANVYWGIHTLRAINNFPVSGITVSDHPEIIHAYGAVKLACARTNRELGGIDAYQAELVDRACSDVIAGKLDDQFPVDVLQGGAGTSTNMNVNEVIANRALELGHYPRGEYEIIHPNDTVNKSQSTNDSYPAAARLALIDASHTLIDSTRKLSASFSSLSQRTMTVVKIGRTQLQDAVPMTFGQEFGAFASQLGSDAALLEQQHEPLSVVNLGGTAIGTGICADVRFRELAARHLATITGLPGRRPGRSNLGHQRFRHALQRDQAHRTALGQNRQRSAPARQRPACRTRRNPTAAAPGRIVDHARQGEPGDPGMREPDRVHGHGHGHHRLLCSAGRAVAA